MFPFDTFNKSCSSTLVLQQKYLGGCYISTSLLRSSAGNTQINLNFYSLFTCFFRAQYLKMFDEARFCIPAISATRAYITISVCSNDWAKPIVELLHETVHARGSEKRGAKLGKCVCVSQHFQIYSRRRIKCIIWSSDKI